MSGSFRLGHIAGIEIRVNYTWFLALIIITWSLADGIFPSTWNPVTLWSIAILTSLLLFVSVVVHELAHSLVAKARGIGVRSITLFIFGGVSNIEDEPAKPMVEFQVAIVGPLTSIVLAGIFWGLALLMKQTGNPVLQMLSYLAIINAILAGFNLLPGFPLDGGRVLRSIVWGATKSLPKATKVATTAGQILGWGFIAVGLYFIFSSGDFMDGLWIALIGWLLIGAASVSKRQVMIKEDLTGVRVNDVMKQNLECVTPGTTVESIVQVNFTQHGRNAVPVCLGDQTVGIVTVNDVKKLPREMWAQTPVTEIMTRPPFYAVNKNDDLSVAIKLMRQYGLEQVLVTDEGKMAGLLSAADIYNYLQLKRELLMTPGKTVSGLKTNRTALVILGTLIGYGAIFVAQPWLSLGLLAVGMGLTVYGCYLWAKLKGRGWAWMLFGLLSPIGLLVLAVLKQKQPAASAPTFR